MRTILAAVMAVTIGVWGAASQAADNILVFGGNRATGLETVKELVAKKAKVTVFVRAASDTTALKPLGVKLVTGDVLQPGDVKAAFASAKFTAIVSALGGGRNEPRPDFDGIKNIVDAAKVAGVKRMVMVTAIGAGDSNVLTPESLKKILQPVLIEKGKAEEYLVASGLDYTIIRPGGLKNGPATGKAGLTDDHNKYSDIQRADLGILTADSVWDKKTSRKILHAIDPTMPSAMAP